MTEKEKFMRQIQKIKTLQDEVCGMHNNPVEKSRKEILSQFWRIHVQPVIEIALYLTYKYEADLSTVWLSAILHDVAHLDSSEPHDEIGAEKAYQILLKKDFDSTVAETVKNTILTHRCKKYQPETLEQKIITTADAISHFKTAFYLWRSFFNPQPFQEQLKDGLEKIERDYNNKIFFDDEKKLVQAEYEVLKRWFTCISPIG